MKNSNLAERLEEYAASVEALESGKQKPTVVVAFVAEAPISTLQLAPRRSSFGSRRIVIRDEGLRPFRVS